MVQPQPYRSSYRGVRKPPDVLGMYNRAQQPIRESLEASRKQRESVTSDITDAARLQQDRARYEERRAVTKRDFNLKTLNKVQDILGKSIETYGQDSVQYQKTYDVISQNPMLFGILSQTPEFPGGAVGLLGHLVPMTKKYKEQKAFEENEQAINVQDAIEGDPVLREKLLEREKFAASKEEAKTRQKALESFVPGVYDASVGYITTQNPDTSPKRPFTKAEANALVKENPNRWHISSEKQLDIEDEYSVKFGLVQTMLETGDSLSDIFVLSKGGRKETQSEKTDRKTLFNKMFDKQGSENAGANARLNARTSWADLLILHKGLPGHWIEQPVIDNSGGMVDPETGEPSNATNAVWPLKRDPKTGKLVTKRVNIVEEEAREFDRIAESMMNYVKRYPKGPEGELSESTKHHKAIVDMTKHFLATTSGKYDILRDPKTGEEISSRATFLDPVYEERISRSAKRKSPYHMMVSKYLEHFETGNIGPNDAKVIEEQKSVNLLRILKDWKTYVTPVGKTASRAITKALTGK